MDGNVSTDHFRLLLHTRRVTIAMRAGEAAAHGANCAAKVNLECAQTDAWDEAK
jgi:hypothetical protein